MHKFILKIFGFLKSCIQFVKVATVFCILMLLLYWIENLAGYNWEWLGFISPLLDGFLAAGEMISKGSVNLFAAVFEFKYLAAVILFLLIYFIAHLVYQSLTGLEEVYADGRRLVKKIEEDCFNKKLEKQNISEQKRIKNYKIYIETRIKKKFCSERFNINLEEQNKIMNKFIIEKLGIAPVKFNNGFMYSFGNFEDIDSVLEVMFKILKAETPIDYMICIQISGADIDKECDELNKLISLEFYNNITMVSDTAYRYGFNEHKKYGISQMGLFQKEGDTFEVHRFEEL